MTWSTRTSAIRCAPCTAVRIARSVSGIASTSPPRTPRERVVAAPITRNRDCPAMCPTPSPRAASGSKRSTRQAVL